MERFVFGLAVLFPSVCVANDLFVEAKSLRIETQESSAEETNIKIIQTKQGRRIQLTTPDATFQAKRIMVRCLKGPSADYSVITMDKNSNLMNIVTGTLHQNNIWPPWPDEVQNQQAR